MIFRRPRLEDGASLKHLVALCDEVDDNSCYLYLLLCNDFSSTCLIAEDDEGAIAGFVTGYIPPKRGDCLFVWQVVVSPHARRQGLALRMLSRLVEIHSADGMRFVEATITPGNQPSRKLFGSLADKLATEIHFTPYFLAEHFGEFAHEDEELCRVGPISP